jgi:membrane-associated phospholipid phosphatase
MGIADPAGGKHDDAIEAWRAYARWFLILGVIFFSVYPFTNWWTAQRDGVLQLHGRAELEIPFVPVLIWPYLSLYLLFLIPPFVLTADAIRRLGRGLAGATLCSGLVFLIVPAGLGFPRQIPDDPLYGPIFSAVFDLDHPYNMVPSLHVVFSALIVAALSAGTEARPLKTLWWLWLFLLSCSTLLVHQHHLLDVISGLLVATVFHQWTRTGGSHA